MRSKHVINRKISRISIRLCFIVSTIFVFVFAVNFARTSHDSINDLDKQYRNKASSIIATANIAVEKRQDFGSGDYLQDLCRRLKAMDPDFLSISVSTVKKNVGLVVIAGSNRKEIGRKIDDTYYTPLRNGETIFRDNNDLFNKARELEVLGPLYSNNKPVAVISVIIDYKSRDAAIRGYVYDSMIRTMLALLLMAVMLYLTLRIEVFKPLWQLTADAKEIARGDFRRRSLIDSNNEIGELAREFNILAVYLQQREEENERLLKSVKEKWVKAEAKSNIDFLTNLENHRSFQDRLAVELDRASRNGQPLSLLFCDLDKFKVFNDTNGHILGDKALFEVARIVKQSIRAYDMAARYGGEEFAVILPNADTVEAVRIAERIRNNVSMHTFTIEGGLGNLTISIGVATFPNDAETKEMIITSADYAMYESKKLKGNTVTIFTSFGNFGPRKAS